MTPLRRLARLAGVDRATGFTLLTHAWGLAIRPISLYMTLRFLTPDEQGYFYTFASILGLQVFFELGIGIVMQQSVSHETGHLHWTDAGTLDGDATAKSRLASLMRLMWWWYLAIAVTVTVTVLPLGWWMFGRADTEVAWHAAWVATVVATIANILLTPPTMLLSGSGRIADVAQFVTVQTVASNLTMWVALAAGGGLLAAPIGTLVAVLLLVAWLARRWRPMFRDLRAQPRQGPAVDWWREIWPFQWKVAVSWPFGYLVYQLFTPILFVFRGPEEAGMMGISLAATTMLTNLAMAWISPKMPAFGHMIARRDWTNLDRTFRAAFVRSTALAVTGAVGLWLVLVVLQVNGHPYAERFLSPAPMAFLAASAVINHVVSALAAYVRAHRRDPFVAVVIGMGLLLGASLVIVGRSFGAEGMVIVYFVLNVAFCIVVAAIAARCRRNWHAEEPLPV